MIGMVQFDRYSIELVISAKTVVRRKTLEMIRVIVFNLLSVITPHVYCLCRKRLQKIFQGGGGAEKSKRSIKKKSTLLKDFWRGECYVK